MKIAFVNQPIDTIIPPNQNSVGACTLGAAQSLARSADVLVYGLKDNHSGLADLAPGHGIEFRFIPSTWHDRVLFNTQKKYAKLFHRSSPISTSQWLYPSYGRQVALDLQQQGCDVIHLQHCTSRFSLITSKLRRNGSTKSGYLDYLESSLPADVSGKGVDFRYDPETTIIGPILLVRHLRLSTNLE